VPENAQLLCGNSYSYLLDSTADAAMQALAAHGFRVFELMAHPGHLWPAEMDAAKRRALRGRMEEHGHRVLTVNMPNLDVNVAATFPEMRAASLDLLEGILRLAGEIGARAMVIGPGKPNPLFPAPRERLTDYAFAALERLLPVARASGVELWMENMPFAFLPDAESLMTAIERFGEPSIGVVYDIANAHFIGESLAAGRARIGDRLKLIHVSDTARDAYRHAAIGDGTVPWDEYRTLLPGIPQSVPVVFEIATRAPEADFRRSLDAYRGIVA